MPGESVDTSVLEEFTTAKRKIGEIFEDIDQQVEAVQTFIETVQKQDTDYVLQTNVMNSITDLVKKIKGVFEILQRDQMKCVFFGRTSNGKSTCINAMLWDKVLPSGIGHTTSCFLSVEGSNKPAPYIVTEEGETMEIEKVQQLANALSQNQQRLSESSLVRVLWPQVRCRLLNAEVQILDSPGVDVTPDLDLWIDKYCLNADVFVLVANAESTIMQAEKKFFQRVSETLSKPNIFILQNRWDASAQEPETMEEVKKQHEERAIDFLVNELEVYETEEEAQERVFFISAREMLNMRMNRSKGIAENPDRMPEGYKARQLEFEEFERNFEECISQSAIKTKFEQHITNGEEIVKYLSSLLKDLNESAKQISAISFDESDTLKMRRDFNKKQLDEVTTKINDKIEEIKSNVLVKVTQSLENELEKIESLIENFEGAEFHSNKIEKYRNELIKHVENGFRQNLVSYCSSSLIEEVRREKAQMIYHLTNVIKDSVDVTSGFDLEYEMNFIALNDFEEDIEFKFWASPTNLVKMIPYGKLINAYGLMTAIEQFSSATAQQVPLAIESATCGSIRADDIDYITRFLPQGLFSYAGWKAYKWSGLSEFSSKILITAGVTYASLYLFERLRYTKFKQEQLFRFQFGEHAKEKLRNSVHYTSSKCSQQVENELRETFTRLELAANEVTTDIEDNISDLDEKAQKYDGFGEMAKNWKNKFDWLEIQLKNYRQEFIRKSSK